MSIKLQSEAHTIQEHACNGKPRKGPGGQHKYTLPPHQPQTEPGPKPRGSKQSHRLRQKRSGRQGGRRVRTGVRALGRPFLLRELASPSFCAGLQEGLLGRAELPAGSCRILLREKMWCRGTLYPRLLLFLLSWSPLNLEFYYTLFPSVDMSGMSIRGYESQDDTL